ncbi:MAG: UDP-N-acetylmuramoyl-L-alanyl-D-glutamate--2 6-diaminopimelate ligase [Bacillota bacterium]|nr:MAG: UDP-N-acetylmuramoyl-L-alanyl-D-glutamate--2 6-diaminopimelate ligase [Bacillota bacterium]
MNFRDLLQHAPVMELRGDATVTGVTHSSSEVRPGNIFVAIKGARVDGHDFITQALAQGAGGVITTRPVDLPAQIAWALAEDSRIVLSIIAAAFYGHPSRSLRLVGITGTNGKTTTAFLIRAILREQGLQTGMIGTVQIEVGQEIIPVKFTTPEAHDLQALLKRMKDSGISHAVMEVSSHSLVQHRVDNVEYDTAVFTNLTQDHLDLHGTMEDYFAAKAQLFTRLGVNAIKPAKTAVINVDDPWGQRLVSITSVRVMSYAIDCSADITAQNIKSGSLGSSFVLVTPQGEIECSISTPGKHSIYNALAAAGAGLAEGCSLQAIAQGLQMPPVPGRMEQVNEGQSFAVFIDYAHSPDGLENVLQAARGFACDRVIVVFGCGGDRDRGKRPLMGAIAAKLSDVAILTSDNPRSEDPLRIIEDVLPGFYGASAANRVIVEPDRRNAIQRAIFLAEDNDVVLITGKGHENYQIFRGGTVYFDDREEARTALRLLNE